MLNKKNLPNNNQDLIGYAAGLFDGEGNVNYAQYQRKSQNKKTYLKWNIAMEIAMTDLDCIKNFYDIVGVGSIYFKGVSKGSMGKKDQWRWRCSHQKLYSQQNYFTLCCIKKRKVIKNYKSLRV